MKKNTHKKWLVKVLVMTVLSVFLVCAINYINDPLWVFNHSNFSNKEQVGFNERQQKTNRLYFGKNDYDSIILGNSKVTYVNQNKFTKGKLFNYSVSAMDPKEYNDYIEFSKEVIGEDLKYIIIGLDFIACQEIKEQLKDPRSYISQTKSKLYKYKHLMSYNTLFYVFRNWIKYFDEKKAVYYRNNVKIKKGYDDLYDDFILDLKEIKTTSEKIYKNSVYNQELINIFQKIRDNNQNSKFIIMLLPDFMPGFLLTKEGKETFESCKNDASKIFGKVHNFMYFSEINSHPKNYYDNSHFRPYVGDKILKDIEKNL